MKRIDCGVSGDSRKHCEIAWDQLDLDERWLGALNVLCPDTSPRPIQVEAFREKRVLDTRRNLIISAPTNSGKSLIATLVMLDAVKNGRHAVLLEPLRAIAREKTDELATLSSQFARFLGAEFKVQISTGDYRLEDETFESAPQQGEMIIATPERFEAILRNSKNDPWVESIDVVCIDEAHLISSANRGPTLEYLITYLQCLQCPPRIVLLSATLGETTNLEHWLDPADVVSVKSRYPALHKEIIALEENEDPSATVVSEVRQILANPGAQVLVFVYQTASAEKLARTLNSELGELVGGAGALAYHARMSPVKRSSVSQVVVGGTCRCVVATTALGMGVNLPVDHVILRDLTFAGTDSGKVSISEILQMIGRAGRGNNEGRASVVLRPSDRWSVVELEQALVSEEVSIVTSPFAREIQVRTQSGTQLPPLTPLIASQLARRPEDGFTREQLENFFARSLGGQSLIQSVPDSLRWLVSHVLAYPSEEGHYCLTSLGRRATLAVMPLPVASGFGRLIRDLLTVSDDQSLLCQWKHLDHLVCLDLLSARNSGVRITGAKVFDKVDAWMESHPDHVPLLYRNWIMGSESASNAVQVLGSLGVETPKGTRDVDKWAHKTAYSALVRSIILYERGLGTSCSDIERHWGVSGLDDIEERWRDEMLWLLSGVAKLSELGCFYYHLLEDCKASTELIQSVSRQLKVMRRQVYDLMDQTKYCSALGPMLRSIKRAKSSKSSPGIGVQTIRTLEESGIRTVAQLVGLSVEQVAAFGVRKHIAKELCAYVRRRSQ